jgi:hypothetical protein
MVQGKSKLNIDKYVTKNDLEASGYKSTSPFPAEGTIFGKWTTLDRFIKRGHSLYVMCKCECGLERSVCFYDLLRGHSKRCQSCAAVERNTKHGQNVHGKITYEYRLWINQNFMKQLDGDWEKSFELFFKDLGPRPDKKLQLCKKQHDRKHSIDNSFWGHPRLKFFKDIKGKTFGKWTVLEPDLIGSKGVRWLCRCDCGRQDYIGQWSMLNGKTTRCKACSMKGKTVKHGLSKTPEYQSYYSMIRRCTNPKDKNFHHYGGRGITVCDRWLQSFDNFIQDVGKRPDVSYSLDRKDVNLGYFSENCKWSSQREQCNNKRNVKDLQEELDKYKKKYGELIEEDTSLHWFAPIIL